MMIFNQYLLLEGKKESNALVAGIESQFIKTEKPDKS